MKVAYFSPLPPSRSGIADYSALLVPALEQLLDVEVVRPGPTQSEMGTAWADEDAAFVITQWIKFGLARHPRLLKAYGQMEMGQAAAAYVPARMKTLASIKAALLIGCPY